MERTSPVLDALLPRTKQRLLAAILLRPDKAWYMRELARSLQVQPSSLQRELRQFVGAGIITERRDGNRIYFQADRRCPIFDDLSRILAKTSGLADLVRDWLNPFSESIEVAFIYGSVSSAKESSSSDVDVLIVGALSLARIAPTLRALELRLGRSVNPKVYTSAEFAEKVSEGNHFLSSVLETDLLFVAGNANDLARLVGRAKGAIAPNRSAGNPRSAGGRRARSARR